jgi:hypothetical protein
MLDAISYEASELARTGRALLDRAGSSGNMVITHENGSNLEVGFDPEGSTIMDGVVDGVKRLWADLPEGTVAFPVIKGRVDGTIEFNLPLIVSGRGLAELDSEGLRADGLRLSFRKGALQAAEITGGDSRIRELLMASSSIEKVYIGLNPRVQIGFNLNHLAEGVVSVNLGLGLTASLKGASLFVGDEALVDRGKLKI